MKRTIIIGLATLCTLAGAAQSPYPSGRLYEIKMEMDMHLDTIQGSTPDSIFFGEGGEYGQFQKWFDEWNLRLAPHGDFDVYHQVLKSYYEDGVGNIARGNTDPWDEIGPTHRPNIQYGASTGVGRIEHISIFSQDDKYMLCSSITGGLFYSADHGASWFNVGTDDDPGLAWRRSGCWRTAFHPTNPNIFYGLTSGEGASGNITGAGHYKESNPIGYVGGVMRWSGSFWERIADYNDLGGDLHTYLHAVEIDEKLNSSSDYSMFIGTDHGLYKSDDPNSTSPTWTFIPIFAPPSVTSAHPGFTFALDDVLVKDLTYSTSAGSSTLYGTVKFVGTYGTSTVEEWRAYQSNDDGINWTEISGQPSPTNPVVGITVEVTHADPDLVYFDFILNPINSSQIWQFNEASVAWNMHPIVHSPVYGGGYGFVVSNLDPNIVIVSNSTTARLHNFSTGSVSNTSGFHLDVDWMSYNPHVPGEIWMGCHGGVYKSNSNGVAASWVDMTNDNLGVARVEGLATSYLDPSKILIGAFDDGSMMTEDPYTIPWTTDWKTIYWGDGYEPKADPNDPNFLYVSYQNGHWRRYADCAVSGFGNNATLSSQFATRGAINWFDSRYMYFADLVPNLAGSSEPEITRSFDWFTSGGETISDFGNDLSICLPPSTDYLYNWENFLSISASPVNAEHLYVAMRDAFWKMRLFRNTDVNNIDPNAVIANWHEMPVPRDDGNIAGIAYDWEDETIVYLSYSSSTALPTNQTGDQMVFRMDYSDLGAYSGIPCDCSIDPCEDITMNLPNTFAGLNTLTFEKGSNGGIYFATEFGLYYTNNERIDKYAGWVDPDNPFNTSGWVKLGTGLPHVGINGAEINYEINRIRVGTRGRGVWEHDLYCPDLVDVSESGTYTSDLFLEVQNDITSVAMVPAGLDITYRAGNQISLQPGFGAENGSRFHAFIHPCNMPGNSFRTFEFDEDELPEQLVELDEDFLVYPNPSEGLYSLVVPNNVIGSTVMIFNSIGQTIFEKTVQNETEELDLTLEENGVYYLIVVNDSEQWSSKLVKY